MLNSNSDKVSLSVSYLPINLGQILNSSDFLKYLAMTSK